MPLGTSKPSVAEAANIIKLALDDWAGPLGGTTKIIANVSHLWEELSAQSNKPRLLICYNGEESRGDTEVKGHWQRVDRQWQVVVIRGHGFKNNTADQNGDALPFYDCLEQIRDVIRSILNIGEEWPPVEYIGMEPLPSLGPNQAANIFMDATSLRFTTANDLKRLSINIQQNQ